MMHWAMDYIGGPWVEGKSDCWHFARRVWRERYGWDVPEVFEGVGAPLKSRRAFSDDEAQNWAEVTDPREGDGVVMAVGRLPCHVGIWIEPEPIQPGGILHSVEGAGVIYTPRAALNAIGYRVTGYYRRAI